MSYVARTVWAVECNRCGCSYADPEEDGELLLLNTTDGGDYLARDMREQGWIAVGGARHFCPPCTVIEQAAVMDRLVIATACEPLPFDGGEA